LRPTIHTRGLNEKYGVKYFDGTDKDNPIDGYHRIHLIFHSSKCRCSESPCKCAYRWFKVGGHLTNKDCNDRDFVKELKGEHRTCEPWTHGRGKTVVYYHELEGKWYNEEQINRLYPRSVRLLDNKPIWGPLLQTPKTLTKLASEHPSKNNLCSINTEKSVISEKPSIPSSSPHITEKVDSAEN
jgi:hypothetical protein